MQVHSGGKALSQAPPVHTSPRVWNASFMASQALLGVPAVGRSGNALAIRTGQAVYWSSLL